MKPEWSDLKIKAQHRSKPSNYYHNVVPAFDTETIAGKAVLITDQSGRVCFPANFAECIEFITPKTYQGTVIWFKNLNYDVEALLKWLDEKTIREFRKTCELEITIRKQVVKIMLIPGKMLKIVRGKNNFAYFDIGNFLKGSLDVLAEKYLGERKLAPPIDFSVPENQKIENYHDSRMVKYCIRDSELTSRLAKQFMDTCNNFGLYSRNYCSPASLATNYFSAKCDLPTLAQITSGKALRAKLAFEAYKGGFISTFKRGYFEEVYLYDINSAYPHEMARLTDLTKGRFQMEIGAIPPQASLGWLRCIVRSKTRDVYGPDYFCPLPSYIRKLNRNFYLAGEFKTTITLLEYDALKNDFDIQPLEGIYWIPEQEVFPMKGVIEELYELKSKYKNGDQNLYSLIKILMNGFYGKTIQKIPQAESREFKTGNFFNPFHASYITAGCRIQAYDLIKQYGPENVIAVMTDGVAFSQPIDVPTSKKLGEWSLDMVGEGVFLGSGLYTIRADSKIKTATRGFRITDKYDFFTLLAQNEYKTEIELPQNVRLSFKEALRIKKFADWNIIRQGMKKIKINCDTKRNWARDFENCGDALKNVIDSTPIYVNIPGKTLT